MKPKIAAISVDASLSPADKPRYMVNFYRYSKINVVPWQIVDFEGAYYSHPTPASLARALRAQEQLVASERQIALVREAS